MPKKAKIEQIREFAKDNGGLIFIVGSPLTDELYLHFNGEEALYRFPENDDPTQNVIFQVLNKGTFHFAIDAFLTAIYKGLGLTGESDKKISDKHAASFLGLVDAFVFNTLDKNGKMTGKQVRDKVVDKSKKTK